MPIDASRIRAIVAYNRRDVLGLDAYLRAKYAALFRWCYWYMERERRARESRRLRRMAPEERVDWLRANLGRLPGRAGFYARSILAEVDARAEIDRMELYLPRARDPAELLRLAAALKRREVEFFSDLRRSLLTYLPGQTRWIAEVERVMGLAARRLGELESMAGSLEGRVYDAGTGKPIEGAEVELVPLAGGAALRAATDRDGRYRIDMIPPGDYRARCRAGGYEEQEDTLSIEGGRVRAKDWFLRRVAVPRAWEYRLRVSARVVRGYTIERKKGAAVSPSRWVQMTVELSEELASLPEEERRRAIMGRLGELIDRETKRQRVRRLRDLGMEKSPIFVELFFEKFISSLDEVKLEERYREELTGLVEAHREEIARALWFREVEFGEWDFGIESKEPSKFAGEESGDWWEIYVYPPSGYAQFVAEGEYRHPVGEGEEREGQA
jgi:hypothetical protein